MKNFARIIVDFFPLIFYDHVRRPLNNFFPKVVSFLLRHSDLLILQKRFVLHEKQRERCHADIEHRVLCVLPRSLVEQAGAFAPHFCQERFENLHILVGTTFKRKF